MFGAAASIERAHGWPPDHGLDHGRFESGRSRAARQIAEAYRVCREIARKEAKNFYYSFVALPEAKRDAICAVYAFMRHADDLSDDESLSVAERQARLDMA